MEIKMSTAETKGIALEFLAALRDRNIDRMSALVPDDFDYWLIGDLHYSGSLDKPGFLKLTQALCDLIDGPLTITPDEITAEDDRVSITGRGDMVATNGTVYANHYHFLFTVRDGKIVKMREYLDPQDVKNLLASFRKK
jgi:ketosteroid isomerase-like protein